MEGLATVSESSLGYRRTRLRIVPAPQSLAKPCRTGELWGTCVLMTNMPPDVAFGRRSGKEKREKTGAAFQSMNPLNFMA